MSQTRILITSAGSRVGQALLEALMPERERIYLIGTNSTPMAPNLFACDQACLLPPTSDQAVFEAALSELLEREQPQIVIPARDQDILPLGRLSRDPRFTGTVFLAAPPELAPVFSDKYETWRFAQTHKLPFARSAYTAAEADALVAACGFPLVAKPRWDGHASRDVYLVQNEAQLTRLIAAGGFVLQELLHAATLGGRHERFGELGIPWLFSMRDVKCISELLIGRDGQVVSLSNNDMLVDRAGNKTWHVSDNPAVTAVAKAYGESLGRLGYRGPLNLQGKLLKDGRFDIFELNGRFTGSANARAFLGYNQVLHALGHFLKAEGPWPQHESGKYWGAVEKLQGYEALEQTALDSLQQQRVWSRDD